GALPDDQQLHCAPRRSGTCRDHRGRAISALAFPANYSRVSAAMVCCPPRRPAGADHEYRPPGFWPLLRDPEYLPRKYVIMVLKLVAIRRKDDWPAVRVTVELLRNTGEGVAAYDRVLRESMIRVDQRGPEGNRHDHLLQFRAILGRNLEDLQRALRGGGHSHFKRGPVIAPDAGTTYRNRSPDELSAMAIAHPGSDLALESGADAAYPDRIIDDVIRPGLTNGDRRKSGHKSLPVDSRYPSPAAFANHRPARADIRRSPIVLSGRLMGRSQSFAS